MDLKKVVRDYVTVVDNGVKAALFIEGAPGVGKTQIVTRVFKQLGLRHEVLSLLALSVDDLGGMAYPVNNGMKYLEPCWYSDELDGVFFDETGGINVNKQQVLLKLLSERVMATGKSTGLKYIVLAGNSIEDTSGDEFLRPFKMRIINVKYEPDIDEFINYLITVGEKWSSTLIAILKHNPAIFLAEDKENGVVISPRLLESAARILVSDIDERSKMIFLAGVLYKYAAEFKYATELLSYDVWKHEREKYLEKYKDEAEKLILLSYAVPLSERIEYIEDLKTLNENVYAALIKELAVARIIDEITDPVLKEKYVKWASQVFDKIVSVFKENIRK